MAKTMTGVTKRLCDRIVAITTDGIGESAMAKARQLVLDGIAVAVAGARIETAPHIIAEYLRKQGSNNECSALGFGFRLSPVPTALLNATSMHVLDFEPMWTPATHALSPALAPVLAVSESIGAGGREVLLAVIKGVEIQGWISQACGHVEASEFRFQQARMEWSLGGAGVNGHVR